MAELTFSQPERRSYLVPSLVVLVLVGIAGGLIYQFTPHRIADITVTSTAAVPIHTVIPSGSMVVGAQETVQDDLYLFLTVRIDDKLKLPLFIKDITGAVTTGGADLTASAIEKTEFDNLYITFPQLKPHAAPPLLRETSIQPNGHAEGMVLLHFPVTQAQWDQRTNATLTITTYSQGNLTIPIPKS
ncbi:MAG: hypothetical protein ABR910_17805 [Acidobacteriaceae bacterium]|jgi:hypothetical protein